MQRWRLLIFATSFRDVFKARRGEGMAAAMRISPLASNGGGLGVRLRKALTE
jgi:hypothetical protein